MALQYSPTLSGPGGWPSGAIPTEVFWVVASYLPDREDIKSMRLVNREFNGKVLCHFMKQVVISFGPEQAMKFADGVVGGNNLSSFDMTEKVLKSTLFHYLAPHIQRLGLTLELSEDELASPNVDNLDEICLRSWGVYRWFVPSDKHLTPLEKVTMALEKCQGVVRLLSKVTNVREFALSCDGCLGYLQGPDVNPFQPPGRLPVFGNHNAVRVTEDKSLQVRFDKSYKLEVIERKLAAAGVKTADIPRKISQLRKSEGITLKNLVKEKRDRAPLPLSRYQHEVTRDKVNDDQIRLQPDQLTESQKWYMHRHLSTQGAMIQSFMITMLDNSTAFTRLTKLNLARIPSFHLDSLCRDDFWSSLPQVEDVALGVIPDWRSLKQESQFDISVRQVYPTDAIPKVFNLLKNYIGKQPNIERLHFEWHCGGEFAAGIAQRGRYVLPAPFIAQHRMVIDSSQGNILILPYITHLSLKNCWFAPNVFYRIMKTMAADRCLESLELESVSLSGCPIIRGLMADIDPMPHQVTVHTYRYDYSPQLYVLRAGWNFSWSHVIDLLSPIKTISETVGELLGGNVLPRTKKGNKIQRLVFKSCGYVDVPDKRFISYRHDEFIISDGSLFLEKMRVFNENNPRMLQMERFVQVSTDRHLATVRDLFDPMEELALEKVYGLRTGWAGVYDEAMIKAAKRDGAFSPGIGRFSGTIERVPDVVSADDDDLPDVQMNTAPFEHGYDDANGLSRLLKNIEQRQKYTVENFGPQ
ncbi:uncharacterized protein GGS22DRAFT_76294 [Annulohypoxylon maeteangense]|uniref:uncharacterized protein n=1 Tax=Annulohypoxylon maeteangense TaxID=1927788 RepID=UPI0020077784|nr:uncharacterized protein GGS22DRAFT_76294 [Annulohypoxylon maeteangense]KAI0881141.1 hypothetical protein GGS22DRAFT_76294 [Annulohypoxylon maeteangense]